MRAKPLTDFDTKDHELAREYVLKYLPDALGIKLEEQPDSSLLVNTTSGSTYYPYPMRVDDAGYFIAFLDDNQLLVSNRNVKTKAPKRPTFLVGLDPKTSEAFLIGVEKFDTCLKAIRATPFSIAGMNIIPHAVGEYVTFTRECAVQNFLVKLKVLAKEVKGFAVYRMKKLAVKEQFVHLHNHSEYSFLDGVSNVGAIARQAYFNGQPGIALTDHGNMHGTYKFWNACNEWGVKPILGMEAYVVDDVGVRYKNVHGANINFNYHQTLLAMNQEGYENLCKLLTIGGRDHFYHVARIDHRMLFEHHAGLIVLSGCFKGPVAWHLMQHDPEKTREQPWCRNDPDHSLKMMKQYKKVFGDRYYAELQSNDFARYMFAMPQVAEMAKHAKVPCVVTNDAHYPTEDDAYIQSISTRISKSREQDEADGGVKKKGPYWIKPMSLIEHSVFTPDMFARTCEIMERCEVSLKADSYLVPPYDYSQDVDWKDFCHSKGNHDACTPKE